ncbi:MAG: hypothetical protein MJ223_01600 [Mycoplasmoidaceae bacterium]|nr:hypothetical protein [Mycoplasmoidaceae bacterium]
MIGQTIVDQSKKIERYKREIDRINPAILQGTNDIGIDLHKGVSEVIVSQNQVPDNIYKLFKNLNKGKTEENRNGINTILFNLEHKKILDKNDKIKQD